MDFQAKVTKILEPAHRVILNTCSYWEVKVEFHDIHGFGVFTFRENNKKDLDKIKEGYQFQV